MNIDFNWLTNSPPALISPAIYAPGAKSAEVTYQDTNDFYIIVFSYDSGFCTIPATYPAGCPHYSATITVYRIVDGQKKLVAEFGGTYTARQCYEDEPSALVAKAKALEAEKQ